MLQYLVPTSRIYYSRFREWVQFAFDQRAKVPGDSAKGSQSVLAVIPARLQSTRLPNKPLLKIGAKTMLEWVWERSCQARLVDQVVIATDHPEIFAAAQTFGAQVVMTDPGHTSGTDRVAEAAQQFE